MIKIIRDEVAKQPMNMPLDQLRVFIDQVMHDLWKQKGRTTECIRQGKYNRASV